MAFFVIISFVQAYIVYHVEDALVIVRYVSKKTGPLLRFEITPTNCA